MTFSRQKSDSQQCGVFFEKFFEKKLKKGVTKQGGNLDSQWWEMMFFGIFSESSNTTGCRFGYNLGRGGVQHASLQLAFEVKMAQKQLQVGDMVGVAVNFSQKKHKKAVLIFKNLEIYLMRINWLDFHAAEKIENFSKKKVSIFRFFAYVLYA